MAVINQILNRKMLFMLLGCLLVFGGIFGFKLFVKAKINEALDNMPLPAATVTSATVRLQKWPRELASVGTLRAVNGVDVTTQGQGEVYAIHFESGQQVAKGDLLVELLDEPGYAQLEVLRAALRLAKRDYERTKTLLASGVTTVENMDQAQSTLEQASANVEEQRAKIKQLKVVAPFSGQLGIRQVDLGQNLKPGDPVVNLQQLDPIYVDFSLPEQNYSQVATGQTVNLSNSAFPNESFSGKITAINPQIDSANRTFLLQATLGNANFKLRPGMFSDVEVVLEGDRQVLIIPRTAISYAPYGNSVFVLQKNKKNDGLIAVKRFIQTGEERGDLVEITKGLKAGEVVASSGLIKLRNEGSVIINNKNPPPENVAPKPENS